jgi:hypothetical protein
MTDRDVAQRQIVLHRRDVTEDATETRVFAHCAHHRLDPVRLWLAVVVREQKVLSPPKLEPYVERARLAREVQTNVAEPFVVGA